MKTCILFFATVLMLAADQAPLSQMFDAKLTTTQRANACFALRGNHDPEVIRAMSRALESPALLSCASENLRAAAAVEPLLGALASPTFEVRAAAVRELGTLQKPELLEPISRAAQDQNLLVATNALGALCQYHDSAVIPYLAALAKQGGMTGDMALDRLSALDGNSALAVARQLLSSAQVPDKLYAMRVIGAAGSSSDLPALKEIAGANTEILSQPQRGFGFMPPINLARAAQSAMASIESRPPGK